MDTRQRWNRWPRPVCTGRPRAGRWKLKKITSEAQYQQERGKDDSKFFPVPGGIRQHRRRTRAYLKLLEQILSR